MNQVPRVPGTQDFIDQEHGQMSAAIDLIRSLFAKNNYATVDTPVLEKTELFVRKSGGELTGRLYNFVDPRGIRVSLRPEFTSSVIRCYVENQDTLSPPVRWQYSGPVFRYENEDTSGLRQFTQVGAELIGSSEIEADAEIISLALSGLEAIGLQDTQIHIGHVGILRELLSGNDLTESAIAFVMANTQSLKSGESGVSDLMDRAAEVGILRIKDSEFPKSEQPALGFSGEFLEQLVSESLDRSYGRRTAKEVVDRLKRKMFETDDPNKLEGALDLITDICSFEGNPDQVIDKYRELARSKGLRTDVLEGLTKLIPVLSNAGIEDTKIIFDLGLARNLSYYTGLTFDLIANSSTYPVRVGGGGRYDGLVRALGGKDIPALGFAYTLDDIVTASRDEERRKIDH